MRKGLTCSKDDHINTYSEIRTRESAQKYQVNNVKNWLEKYKFAIDEDEQDYINKGTDLISIGTQVKDPLVLLAEKSATLQKMFRKKPRAGQVVAIGTEYWSNKWMQGFGDSIIILVGLVMLYGPLWWLIGSAMIHIGLPSSQLLSACSLLD